MSLTTNIVHTPDFDSGVIKILNNQVLNLSNSERFSVRMLKKTDLIEEDNHINQWFLTFLFATQ